MIAGSNQICARFELQASWDRLGGPAADPSRRVPDQLKISNDLRNFQRRGQPNY